MLSSPRNPPWNRFRPPASFRFTHQVKVSNCFCRIRFRKSRSPGSCGSFWRRCFRSISNTRQAAQACTGGFASPKFHSYAGSCPLGCMNHGSPSWSSCCLAKSGVDQCERHRLECQIPGCEPRILPLVRHGKDVAAIEMLPIRVAPVDARRGRWRLPGISRSARCGPRSCRIACSRSFRRMPAAVRAARPDWADSVEGRRNTHRLRARGPPPRSAKSAKGWAWLRAESRRRTCAAPPPATCRT